MSSSEKPVSEARAGESLQTRIAMYFAETFRSTRSRVIAALASVAVVGVGAFSLARGNSNEAEAALIIEGVKDVVRADAFDPEALKFRNVAIVSTSFGAIVCGEVNGKNRMGGYTGYRPFVYNGPTRNELVMVPLGSGRWC